MRTTLLTLLVGMIAAQSAICAPANLVKNAGFESGADAHGLPVGWWLWEQQKGLAKCALDATVRHSGAKSFRVTLAKPGYATLIAPDIPVAPGEKLDVSVWVRAKDFAAKDASGTITVNAAFRREDGKFLRFVKFGKPVPEGKWQQFSAEATIPSGSSKLAVEVGIRNASGTVWFDDACVTARKQYAIRPGTEIREVPMAKSAWPIEIINRTGAKRELRLDAATTGSGNLSTTIRLNGSPVQKAKVNLDVPKPGENTSLRVGLSSMDTKELLAELKSDGIYVLNAVEIEPLVPTHFCIEDGKPTVTARVWNNFTSGSFDSLVVALVDPSGNTLAKKTFDHPKPDCQDVTLSSDKAVLGDYSVAASVVRKNLSVTSSQPWHIIHRSQARVTINAQGFPVADGKPIFPLGTFNSGRYDLMVKTGFTVTHAWNRMYLGPQGTQTENQQALNYLNQTAEAGMKAIGFLHVAYMEREDWDGLRRRIRMFRNHPALLAWDSEEGVARGEVPFARLEKLSKIVKEEDPNHPFVLADSYDVVDKVDRSKFFRSDLMNMGMWWYYPIPLKASGSSSALLGREADDGLTLNPPSFMVSTNKPLWVGMQAYVPDVPGGRLPTEAEFRCLAYIAVVNGAKGLLYYMGGSAGQMKGCGGDRPWGYLQTLVPEIHSLIPVLITPTAPEKVGVMPAERPVSTLLKALDGHYTLIVVNRGNTPCDLTISNASLGAKPVEVLFENRTANSESGALNDHFEGYEVHVYRFAK